MRDKMSVTVEARRRIHLSASRRTSMRGYKIQSHRNYRRAVRHQLGVGAFDIQFSGRDFGPNDRILGD